MKRELKMEMGGVPELPDREEVLVLLGEVNGAGIPWRSVSERIKAYRLLRALAFYHFRDSSFEEPLD